MPIDRESMLAAEKLVEQLDEYVRSGLGTPRIIQLISPLLQELGSYRQYLYNQSVQKKEQRG